MISREKDFAPKNLVVKQLEVKEMHRITKSKASRIWLMMDPNSIHLRDY